jgi:DNA repair exonuclease SbcCD ATPase subunit
MTDWYCCACASYISPESVTNDERHELCGTELERHDNQVPETPDERVRHVHELLQMMKDSIPVCTLDEYGKLLARIAELNGELTEAKRCWDEAETERIKAEAALTVERNLVTSAHRAENAKQRALDEMRHRAEDAEASEGRTLAEAIELRAELAEEHAALLMACTDIEVATNALHVQTNRAEQAEAELKTERASVEALGRSFDKIRAELAALRCCGNCAHETWATDSEEPCTLCHPAGHGGPPSRWTAREDGES